MSEIKNNIKKIIQDGYSKKRDPKKTLRRVYELVDTEEEEEDEEEYEDEEEDEEYDEEEDDAEGDEEEEEDEEDEGGGFFDTLIDMLPDDEE